MNEYQWDKQLNIDTTGRDASNADGHHHPYEPTPYSVLERLAESGYVSDESILVDYGCGKGRVGIFLNHMLGCKTIGLEYDDKIYGQAMQNQEEYSVNRQNKKTSNIINSKTRNKTKSKANIKTNNQTKQNQLEGIEFVCKSAEEYIITNADCFYFFNPFTVEILRAVINRILDSYYENPRQMLLFFYYPDDEYISYLMTVDEIAFLDEIDCKDLFKKEDNRERIMVFKIG